jgi:hypothetical protein
VKTGGGTYLGDAVPHGARAYDTDLLDHLPGNSVLEGWMTSLAERGGHR